MIHNYASYEIALSSEILNISNILASDFVFRGHANSSWDISSSMERELSRRFTPDPTRWFETSIQSEFEKSVLQKIKSAPNIEQHADLGEKDDFSWLALLQHYGCKTRLVDFTESFYVALYFAVRDLPDTNAAVWVIKTSSLDEKLSVLYNKNSSIYYQKLHPLSKEEISRRLVNNSIEWTDRYIDNKHLAIAYGKPEHPNKRMDAQQGLFLCPLNLKRTFKENLTIGLGLTGKKEPVVRLKNMDELIDAANTEKVLKICIPKTLHKSILKDLRMMDIDEATLFPGLDGFVRCLNQEILGI